MGVATVVKDYGTTILNAIRDNDVRALRLLLDKQLKADHKIAALCITDIRHRPTKKFACPLILAARQEDPTIVKYMMDRGVDPNFVHHTVYTSKRREIVTALHIAVDLGHQATTEVLLAANADPNIADHNSETALHIAVKKADRVMTRMLLAKGANPAVADRHGNAALHTATLYGHLQLIKTLLKYDADVYQRGHQGAIPSHIAAREGHIHLVQVFCSRDVGNINIKIPCFADGREKAPLHLAAEHGHVETILALLDQFRADVNLKDSDGNTALHCVVLHRYHAYRMREKDFFYAAAKVLVKYRISVNEKNAYGETALHLAAQNHHQKIVELLLSVGANPFAENERHLKPIDVVSESDPVTKQMLKTAMTQPRPTVRASLLSLNKDLFSPHASHGVTSSGLSPDSVGVGMNSHLIVNPLIDQLNRVSHPPDAGNASFRSNASSIASVFADDMMARKMASQARVANGRLEPVTEQRLRQNERENEIPHYTHVEKGNGKPPAAIGAGKERHHRHSRDRGDSVSEMGSVTSLNSPTRVGPVYDGKKSHRSQKMSVEEENARNYELSKHGEHRHRGGNRGTLDSKRSTLSTGKGHHRHSTGTDHDQSIYENLDEHQNARSRDGDEAKQLKREQRLREKALKTSSPRDLQQETGKYGDPEKHRHPERYGEQERYRDPENYGDQGRYGDPDDDGIRVHTIPGKPSTIEVSYSGGPITISVDTGIEEEENDDDLYGNLPNGHHRDRHHDKEHRRRKQKPDEHFYYNQDEVAEEMRRTQEKKARAEKAARIEQEREEKIQAEMERQQRKQEEEERQERKEEREKRRAKKAQRRQARQEQYQEGFVDVPTEELATGKPLYIVKLPDELKDEESFDSAEFEMEQISKKKAATLRASEVAEGIRKRWSQDEGCDDDEFSGGAGQRPASASSKGSKKPPRPSPAPFDSSGDGGGRSSDDVIPPHPDFVSHSPVVATQENLVYLRNVAPERSGRKSAELLSSNRPTSTEFVSEMKEISNLKIETARVQTLDGESDQLLDAGNNNERNKNQSRLQADVGSKKTDGGIVSYNEEPGSNIRHKFDVLKEDLRPGLNMRVTGEAPKAYNRRDQAAARKAFILAPPVGIESSSEASESEFGSRLSLAESSPGWERAAQRRAEWSEAPVPIYANVPSRQAKPPQDVNANVSMTPAKKTKGHGYIKPYESFGKIEPNTEALDEAVREAQRSMEDLRPGSASSGRGEAGREAEAEFDAKLAAILSQPLRRQRDVAAQQAAEKNRKKTGEKMSPDDDDESFDHDASFDELYEGTLDIYGRPVPSTRLQKLGSTSSKSERPSTNAEGLILPKKVVGVPTAFSGVMLPQLSTGPTKRQANEEKSGAPAGEKQPGGRSHEALDSSDSELEMYDQEPGARRPAAKSRSWKDVKLQPEDAEVAAINAATVDENGRKKNQPKREENDNFRDAKPKASKRGGKITISRDFGNADIAPDVWEEAMSGSPLASSETFEKSGPFDRKGMTFQAANKRQNTFNADVNDPSAARVNREWQGRFRQRPDNTGNDEDDDQSSENSYTLNPSDAEVPPDSPVVGRRQQRQKRRTTDRPCDSWQSSKQHPSQSGPSNLTNEDDPSADKNTSTEKKPDGRKYGRRMERANKSSAILLESGNRKPVFIDTEFDSDLLRSSLYGSREKIDDVLSNLRQRRDSDLYDDDSDMLPPSTFQIPDIVPLTRFEMKLGRRPPKPQKATGGSGGERGPGSGGPGSGPTAAQRMTHRTPRDLTSGVQSDTEGMSRGSLPPHARRPHSGQIHSEAEASDWEPPQPPGPGRTIQQAALDSLNASMVPRRGVFRPPRILLAPGHHDKDLSFIRKLYRAPRPRVTSSRHLFPTAGRYGDSELERRCICGKPRSGTESDGADTDRGRKSSAFSRYHKSGPDLPPRVTEPGPVDFKKFDLTAKLWMEQVDLKTVQKSNTMYLSVLPEGRELPREILGAGKFPSAVDESGASMPPQWVIARGRVLREKLRGSTGGGSEGGERAPTPGGRQLILFFKVGGNWLDLAWVLFDGLQSDADTVRMIKDVQLKHPGALTEQVHDLMHRWWRRRGAAATIDELQRALETVHMVYIQEEFNDPRASFVPYSDAEDDLDHGEVTDADPNVSRLIHEYDVRSVNASFNVDHAPPASPAALQGALNPDAVLRSLQRSGVVEQQSASLLARAARASRAESRNSSLEAGRPRQGSSRLHSSLESMDRDSSADERSRAAATDPAGKGEKDLKMEKATKKKKGAKSEKVEGAEQITSKEEKVLKTLKVVKPEKAAKPNKVGSVENSANHEASSPFKVRRAGPAVPPKKNMKHETHL